MNVNGNGEHVCILNRIEFDGATIEVIRQVDGTIYVSVRSVCKALGLNFKSQLQRLMDWAWCDVVIVSTEDHEGRRQELPAVAYKTVLMWLVNVRSRRGTAHARQRLDHYLTAFGDVVAAWGLGWVDGLGGLHKIKAQLAKIERNNEQTRINQAALVDSLAELAAINFLLEARIGYAAMTAGLGGPFREDKRRNFGWIEA